MVQRIGNNLYQVRNEKGLSQRDLAIKIGVSKSQISRYELNKNDIPATKLILICKALEIKSERILGR